MIGLTKRQADLLAFLTDQIRETGLTPSLRDMAAALQIGVSSIARLLDGLEERGHIRRLRHRARAIDVTCPPPRLPTRADLAKANDNDLARLRTILAAEIGRRLQDTAFARADEIMGAGQ